MADIRAGIDRKANRRGAARLAAVQALYQMEISGAGINDVFAEFDSHWLGNEVEGVTPALSERADVHVRAPMLGAKQSLNVAVATGILLYQLRK